MGIDLVYLGQNGWQSLVAKEDVVLEDFFEHVWEMPQVDTGAFTNFTEYTKDQPGYFMC